MAYSVAHGAGYCKSNQEKSMRCGGHDERESAMDRREDTSLISDKRICFFELFDDKEAAHQIFILKDQVNFFYI